MWFFQSQSYLQIPAATLSKCRVFDEDPVTLEDLNKQSEDSSQGYSAHIESCIQGLLKVSFLVRSKKMELIPSTLVV